MKTRKDKHVKILFRFHSNLLDEVVVETMWAIVVDSSKGQYRLDSIPFYAESLASGDLVFAEYDNDEEMLTYRETLEYSGNTTIQVIVMDEQQDVEEIRKIFKEMGCESEKFQGSFFSMEVPAATDYKPIRQKLEYMMEKGILEYAESSLSDLHSQQISGS